MTSSAPELLRWAPVAIPPLCALAALTTTWPRPLARASAASAAMLVLALAGALGVALSPDSSSGTAVALQGWVRTDGVGATVMLLVAFITVIIVRYSRSYLDGDAGALRYARAMMATVACVGTLVLANHLLLLVLAWAGTGLALHALLTHFQQRTAALVAAHKKFLVSRLADVCLLAALTLFHHNAGTLHMDQLVRWASQTPHELPLGAQVAAVLLVFGVCLKSAQLPFHGWLIQVMEAPTPVSALLHAGVVNMGGLVLIRLAGLMVHAPVAQLLLVVVGTLTAALAALVMTTRVSVKVALAWSTCAQMGFMLLQCGLGAYHLALLHLVAHSLYKAHAFLASGSTVETWRALDLLPAPPRQGLTRWLAAGAVGAVFGGVMLVAAPSASQAVWALGLALALVPLWLDAFQRGVKGMPRALLGSTAMTALTVLWHAAATALFPALSRLPAPPAGPAVVAVGLLALFITHAALQAHPHARLSQRVYQRLFAGLHLDERFTRITFLVWPPRLPAPTPLAPLTIHAEANEA